MSRHRFVKDEVDNCEYYEEEGMYDDLERRICVDDGGIYTYEEFIEFYGGTQEWDIAKVYEIKKKEVKKKEKKGGSQVKQTKEVITPKKLKKDKTSDVEKQKEKREDSNIVVKDEITIQKDAKLIQKQTNEAKKEKDYNELLSFLIKLKIEEPEHAANLMIFHKLDVISLKLTTRDDLLEVGLHPRVIDSLQIALKQDAMKEDNGGNGGDKVMSSMSNLSIVNHYPNISNKEDVTGTSSPGGYHLLSLKDKQWKRPTRPTDAEAFSLATGGGLYSSGGNSDGPVKQSTFNKQLLSMVVVGHVDAGKSTLMGQLLVSSGVVHAKEARKYQKEATSMGKSSFYLAWVMDEGEDERRHGVTIEVAEKVHTSPSPFFFNYLFFFQHTF